MCHKLVSFWFVCQGLRTFKGSAKIFCLCCTVPKCEKMYAKMYLNYSLFFSLRIKILPSLVKANFKTLPVENKRCANFFCVIMVIKN